MDVADVSSAHTSAQFNCSCNRAERDGDPRAATRRLGTRARYTERSDVVETTCT